MLRPCGLFLPLALLAAPAGGQTVVTSSGPDRVAVTVYRDPHRDAGTAPEPEWLNGFALISETRRVSVPAGESDIRFEGVAGGILPQSAIVTGLPDGIVERNRDAYLLSPGTLLDRSLGRRVRLRRTSLATGAVREQEAEIRSGADGAVVLRTADGFEALRCTGLQETLIYDEVPRGLSARPTLSVRARSRQSFRATLTLSYLATGFDWQANYVAAISPDEDRIDLFAWLTLVNGDETGFVGADTQAVAGETNREEAEVEPSEAPALTLQCWPVSTTSDSPAAEEVAVAGIPVTAVDSEEVRLTGTTRAEDLINSLPQAFAARQEELGDLKLYRIPEPVTVAAHSQKQVALLTRTGVQVATVYRQLIYPTDVESPTEVQRLLLTRNRAEEGLGLPLPAGGLVLFAHAAGRPILVGEGHIEDSAIGEEVEIGVGESTAVTTEIERLDKSGSWTGYRLTVTNDRSRPVRFEGEFALNSGLRFRPEQRLPRRDGRPLWTVTVPANASAALRYRVRILDE